MVCGGIEERAARMEGRRRACVSSAAVGGGGFLGSGRVKGWVWGGVERRMWSGGVVREAGRSRRMTAGVARRMNLRGAIETAWVFLRLLVVGGVVGVVLTVEPLIMGRSLRMSPVVRV